MGDGEVGAGVCVARASSCGTASGWRQGGRCRRCRTTHNQEANHSRGIGAFGDGERRIVLTLLRDGTTPEEAAKSIDRTSRFLTARARTDSELLLAMEGAPVQAQRVARMGDYLAALSRTGSVTAAAKELGIAGSPAYWRTDPDFAAAKEAVLRMTGNSRAPRAPRFRATAEELDQVAELLKKGASMQQAATEMGLSYTILRSRAKTHPRLHAALPPKAPARINGRRRAAAQERLPALWSDPVLTVPSICARLGVSRPTLMKWAEDLGLPPRPSVTRGRPAGRQWSAVQAKQLRILWANPNLTLKQMGAELGVSRLTVSNWARDLKLPERRSLRGVRKQINQ